MYYFLTQFSLVDVKLFDSTEQESQWKTMFYISVVDFTIYHASALFLSAYMDHGMLYLTAHLCNTWELHRLSPLIHTGDIMVTLILPLLKAIMSILCCWLLFPIQNLKFVPIFLLSLKKQYDTLCRSQLQPKEDRHQQSLKEQKNKEPHHQ